MQRESSLWRRFGFGPLVNWPFHGDLVQITSFVMQFPGLLCIWLGSEFKVTAPAWHQPLLALGRGQGSFGLA